MRDSGYSVRTTRLELSYRVSSLFHIGSLGNLRSSCQGRSVVSFLVIMSDEHPFWSSSCP